MTNGTQPPDGPKPEKPDKSEKLSYLLDVYKLYHGHINTMFNYFLVLAGLITNAYIQSMNQQAAITKGVSFWIAVFGALLSVISLFIHLRSRSLLDTIENGLQAEETRIFGPTGGFLNAISHPAWFYKRHKYQFPITYWAFIIAFIAMGVYALCAGKSNPRTSMPSWPTSSTVPAQQS